MGKLVRVYMYVDVEISEDTEDITQDAVGTVQRILDEGEPFVGDGGFEVTRVEELEGGE